MRLDGRKNKRTVTKLDLSKISAVSNPAQHAATSRLLKEESMQDVIPSDDYFKEIESAAKNNGMPLHDFLSTEEGGRMYQRYSELCDEDRVREANQCQKSRDEGFEKLMSLAKKDQAPNETDAQAFSRICGTPEGAAIYREYM